MKITEYRTDKAQYRYKKNYDVRPKKQSEVIHRHYYVYLRVKRRNTKDHRYKPAPVAKGLYEVTKIDSSSMKIEETAWSVDNISTPRQFLAPKFQTNQEVRKLFQKVKVGKHTEQKIEKDNINDPVASEVEEERGCNHDITEKYRKSLDTGVEKQKKVEDENEDEGDDTEDYVIVSRVDQNINNSRRYRYAKEGEYLYQVRCYR